MMPGHHRYFKEAHATLHECPYYSGEAVRGQRRQARQTEQERGEAGRD